MFTGFFIYTENTQSAEWKHNKSSLYVYKEKSKGIIEIHFVIQLVELQLFLSFLNIDFQCFLYSFTFP